MNTVVEIYQSVPSFVWAFLLGAPFIVWFVQVLKKIFGVHSTLVIHVMTATSSFLVTAIPLYVLNDPKPWEFLGAYTGTFFTIANILYAASKALVPFWAAVKKYEDKKKAANAGTVTSTTPALPDNSGTGSTTLTSDTTTISSTSKSIPVEYEG